MGIIPILGLREAKTYLGLRRKYSGEGVWGGYNLTQIPYPDILDALVKRSSEGGLRPPRIDRVTSVGTVIFICEGPLIV